MLVSNLLGLGNDWALNRQSEPFPNPFADYASTVMPETIREAHAWAQYIFESNGVYAAAVDKVLSYFITDVEIGGDDVGRDEKKKYEDFLNNVLNIKVVLKTVGRDFLCLHGDTKVVTRDGIFAIRELTGKTVDVLSQGGVYRPAEFKSFGRQPLLASNSS